MPTRRSFLKPAAIGLATPFILPSKVWSAPPSGKLAHASIGISNQGLSDLKALTGSGKIEVVALCDVDTSVIAEAKALWPQARFYQDWRQLLRDEKDKIDSVNIAVPDHMHAVIALSALKAKKHVYCQKPLVHSISEAREMAAAAAEAEKHGLVTQMGNQIQSTTEYRTGVELIKRGEIGKIKEVHLWINASYGPPGRPAETSPVPESLNWEAWLGVAPERPFHKDTYHRFNWRGFRDFGGGAVSDFICHIGDTPKKGIGFGSALSVEATAVPDEYKSRAGTGETWPAWAEYRWECLGSELTSGKTLPIYWYDGGHGPNPALINGGKLPPNGALFIGEAGNLVLPHWSMPHRSDYKRMELPKLQPMDHYHHFVQCALSGGKEKTGSPFTFGGPLTELGLLANISSRFPNKKLDWNDAAMQFPNLPEANAFVKATYRAPWKVLEG